MVPVGAVDLGGRDVLDMTWAGGRLWATTDQSVAVIDRNGNVLAAHALSGGGGALAPASGEAPAVIVASASPCLVRLESGKLGEIALAAGAADETILASLGGLRTLRARGDEIHGCRLNRSSLRSMTAKARKEKPRVAAGLVWEVPPGFEPGMEVLQNHLSL
jgi:hypothetical protein